jgi:hypothetical protein
MAAIAFDTLKAARHLIEAGVPTRQAEAQAELMAEAFVFNVDSLVTRDYLDARLDARFAEQDVKIDARFAEQDSKLDARFAEIDVKFTKIDGNFRLVYWMLTVVILSTTVPAIRMWLAG